MNEGIVEGINNGKYIIVHLVIIIQSVLSHKRPIKRFEVNLATPANGV